MADGVMTRIAESIVNNPAMSGGLMVMALTAAAVVSNALFLQRAHHPEPWFMTRPAPVALAPGSEDIVVPDPRPRGVPRIEPPTPRIQAAAAPTAPEPAALDAKPVLIADLQRALSERGFYRGKIDGISGTRTRAAISAYEKAEGLPVTGQPSAIVLDHITTASVVAAPPPAKPAVSEAMPAPTQVAAVVEDVPEPPAPAPIEAVIAAEPPVVNAPPAEGQVLAYPPKAEGSPPATTASVESAPAVDQGAQRTFNVQRARNLSGYGPVPEDGVAGESTTTAIRRFELDHGLPITGAAGDTVIDRLVAIGAMDAA